MSKVYKLEEGVILYKGDAIGSFENDELILFTGMSKYRPQVEKWLKKSVKPSKKKPIQEEVKEEAPLNWLERLSLVVGVDIIKPHPKNGWRGTKYRDVLMKKYNAIRKAKSLTNEEKKAIFNNFI